MRPSTTKDAAPSLAPGPPPFPGVAHGLVPYSQAWATTKVTLHAISLVLAFVTIIVGGAAAGVSPSSRLWAYTTPTGLACAAWDISEFVVLRLRRQTAQRGIHPGAHVGAELCLWIVSGSMAAMALIRPNHGYVTVYTSGVVSVQSYDDFHGIDIAGTTLLLCLGVIHLVLFGRACKETRQRNKVRTPHTMVYIPGGGRPFVRPDTSVAYDTTDDCVLEYPHPSHTRPAQDGDLEDLSIPPQKEVIPGLVH